ncbi:MAG TPA: hypothetical protein VJU86_00310 [Pyrinomonadaceae bacterium]|nr:hypothetical protein [Pyrinomonadaceae bacterium]
MPRSTVKQPSDSISKPTLLTIRGFQHQSQESRGRGASRVALFAIMCFGCAFLLLSYQVSSQAQTLKARVIANTAAGARVQVDLEFPRETDTFSFLNIHGSILGLAQRIRSVTATSNSGERVSVEKRAPGEFISARKVTRFSYEVDLSPPSRLEDMSHVSWLSSQYGLLMPRDLLPRPRGSGTFSSLQVSFELPSTWTINSGVERIGQREFMTNDPDASVFLVGSDLREVSRGIGSRRLRLMSSGKWPFSDEDVLKISQKIADEYSKATGATLKSDPNLILLPFPSDARAERWTAEARGNTVILLLANNGSRKQRLNRIGILLSHELFHLWVPNSLKLEGDYDWFFEGFTMYLALLTDVRMRLISFNDFLETIGRVYRSYLAIPDRDRLSLIDASANRWTGVSSLIYDKGLLTAFIYDLEMRRKSKCSTSLYDIYKDLFGMPATGQGNANETIIRVLNARADNDAFVKQYVEGRSQLSLESVISDHGLDVRMDQARPRLSVRGSLTNDQRQVLKCLGY